MGGTSVTGSMVGLRSLIGSNSTIEEALIMGADCYETLEECALVAECIPMGIGSNTTLRKCIIDKNARIGSNVQIMNAAGVQEANHEEEGYIIKDGIVSSSRTPSSRTARSSDDRRPSPRQRQPPKPLQRSPARAAS